MSTLRGFCEVVKAQEKTLESEAKSPYLRILRFWW